MLVRVPRLIILPALLALAIQLAASGEPAQPASSADQPPRTDLSGDVLPPGAIARMGTVRFRSLSPDSLKDLWSDLARDNATRGLAEVTMSMLADGGPDTVSFLKGKLGSSPVDLNVPEQVRKALEDLDHESYSVREQAENILLSTGDVAAPNIQAVVAATESLEVRTRGNRILEVLLRPIPSSGEFLRRWRAIRVLERIGTEEAREALKMVETSSPSPRECIEAKEALERLNPPRQIKAVSDAQQPPPPLINRIE